MEKDAQLPKRRKPSPMTAPPGVCPYCDKRRAYNREQVRKIRSLKGRAA